VRERERERERWADGQMSAGIVVQLQLYTSQAGQHAACCY